MKLDAPEVPAEVTPVVDGAPLLKESATALVRRGSGYAAANFATKAVGFLLIPVYTRFLTPADYGIVSLAEITAVIVGLFCGLGLDAAMRRLFFEHVDDRAELRRYVSTVLRAAGLVTLLVTSLSFAAGPALTSWLGARFSVPFFPFVAVAIATAALSQLIDYALGLYQLEGKVREYSRFAIGYFLLTAGCVIFLVVIARRGALGMLAGKFAATAVALAAAAWLSRQWLRGGWDRKFVAPTFRLGLPLVPHTIMALGLIAADRFILQRYRSLDEVGLYSLAYTVAMAMSLVTSSLSQAWTPIFFELARGDDKSRSVLDRLSSGIIVVLALIAVTIAVAGNRAVIWLFDPRYHAAGRVMPWVVGGYLFHALFALFQLSALQGKRPGVIAIVSAIAFTANTVLNLWLIPPLGMYGAAYATLAAYMLEAAFMYAYARRIFPLHYARSGILGALLAFSVAVASSQVRWTPRLAPLMDVATLLLCYGLLWLSAGRGVMTSVWQYWRRRRVMVVNA